MRIKRALAILLTALLLLPFGIAVRGTAETTEDIWALIGTIEDEALSGKKSAKTTTEEYAELTDAVEQAVLAWDGYVEDSLIRNGAVLFWDGKDGIGYGYHPSLRAKMNNAGTTEAPDAPDVQTFDYQTRGGQPDSKNVAVFQPYYGLDTSFTTQYADEGQSIAEAACGTCNLYLREAATIDAIANALETCAVVIFDSHGDTNYVGSNGDYTSQADTSYLCLQSGAGITSADMASVQGEYRSYKHAYYAGYGNNGTKYYYVDGTAIANHMDQPAPNNFLWMAICLGMATDGFCRPLRAEGVEVVYGYSQSVTFNADYKWEAYFWDKMKQGSTVTEAAAYMKEKGGFKDKYERLHPAYPIFVSSEDVYPGHGNVDAKQDVYSTWKLINLLYGDANEDGRITAADSAAVLRHVVGISTLTAEGVRNADADGDGEVTAEDAAMILRYVVNQIDALRTTK